MKCHLCLKDKLRREFPFEALKEDCEHGPLHCLRCTTECVEKNQRCSVCHKPVALDNEQYQECVYTLKRLFPDVEASQSIPECTADTQSGTETIMVSVMGGDVSTFEFDQNMTISQLKQKIKDSFQINPQQQRLLYQDRELKTHKDSIQMKLKDYNVQPPATINLVVILYNIPDSFDEVIFDLFWNYPENGLDYLDASVLLYSGLQFKEVLDWCHKESKTCPAVSHSGDKLDTKKRTGHHKINVKIKSLAADINKMFFTLSAWDAPNISQYPNPSLKFYDARYPEKQLCDDSLKSAADSQAIIMCSLCKIDGEWKVLSLKKLSSGNARDYGPLQNTIQQLIQDGTS